MVLFYSPHISGGLLCWVYRPKEWGWWNNLNSGTPKSEYSLGCSFWKLFCGQIVFFFIPIRLMSFANSNENITWSRSLQHSLLPVPLLLSGTNWNLVAVCLIVSHFHYLCSLPLLVKKACRNLICHIIGAPINLWPLFRVYGSSHPTLGPLTRCCSAEKAILTGCNCC